MDAPFVVRRALATEAAFLVTVPPTRETRRVELVAGVRPDDAGAQLEKFLPLRLDRGEDTNFSVSMDFICSDEGCGSVNSIAVQPDGKVIIGGYFATVNGTNQNVGIARLNSNGSLDSSFNPGTGAAGEFGYRGYVTSITLQSDGNVLIGGDFATVNGVARP